MINVDVKDAMVPGFDFDEYRSKALDALRTLKDRTGVGGEYTGWLWLPEKEAEIELDKIKRIAEKIRRNTDIFLSIGVGGSYLSSRAAVEMLAKDGPEILFSGMGILRSDTLAVVNKLKGRDFYVNIATKSGSTTEPMVAFRVFYDELMKKYGREKMAERIVATTTIGAGHVYNFSKEKGYDILGIPEDVGGRYSALTAVALLPMAVAGLDIDRVMAGAREQMALCLEESLDNPSLLYAAARQMNYRAGKKIEIFSYPGERTRYFSEWWKQLFGESEGKNGKGLFPANLQITADLHSMGQYVQDGERIILETMLRFRREEEEDIMMSCAAEGVRDAHVAGGVPYIDVSADKFDEADLGALFYFFEVACGISGYMMGVNPFDQPGVEAYKSSMRRHFSEKTEKNLAKA